VRGAVSLWVCGSQYFWGAGVQNRHGRPPSSGLELPLAAMPKNGVRHLHSSSVLCGGWGREPTRKGRIVKWPWHMKWPPNSPATRLASYMNSTDESAVELGELDRRVGSRVGESSRLGDSATRSRRVGCRVGDLLIDLISW